MTHTQINNWLPLSLAVKTAVEEIENDNGATGIEFNSRKKGNPRQLFPHILLQASGGGTNTGTGLVPLFYKKQMVHTDVVEQHLLILCALEIRHGLIVGCEDGGLAEFE